MAPRIGIGLQIPRVTRINSTPPASIDYGDGLKFVQTRFTQARFTARRFFGTRS